MKKKRLYILGPNDRFNYGDLLFPYILKSYLEDIVNDIIYCSTSKSDLTLRGGLQTDDFHTLYHLDKTFDNYLIIAGGESLYAGWWGISSYINPKVDRINKCMDLFKLRRIFGDRIYNGILDRLVVHFIGARTSYPFTISKEELPVLKKIIYNSVGASWLLGTKCMQNKKNAQILSSSDYVSVRDKKTQLALEQMNVSSFLVADSAILMSECFSQDFLQEKAVFLNIKPKTYVFFQVSKSIESNKKPELKELVRGILMKYNKDIVFCSIGTALGHKDDEGLSDLFGEFNDTRVHLIIKPSIWDIMWLIKNSYLYIGTSLHGIITSMSFGVPFVTHTVDKVKAYIYDWVGEKANLHFMDIREIVNSIPEIIQDNYDSSNQKESVKESLKRIRKLIQGS